MKPSPRRGGGGANLRLPAKVRSGKGRRREEEPLFVLLLRPYQSPSLSIPSFLARKVLLLQHRGGILCFTVHCAIKEEEGTISLFSLSLKQ